MERCGVLKSVSVFTLPWRHVSQGFVITLFDNTAQKRVLLTVSDFLLCWRRHETPSISVNEITLFQRLIIKTAFSVEQITIATHLSTSKWKTTRYKLFTPTASFNSEPLTG
jgi:hypothetical protein